MWVGGVLKLYSLSADQRFDGGCGVDLTTPLADNILEHVGMFPLFCTPTCHEFRPQSWQAGRQSEKVGIIFILIRKLLLKLCRCLWRFCAAFWSCFLLYSTTAHIVCDFSLHRSLWHGSFATTPSGCTTCSTITSKSCEECLLTTCTTIWRCLERMAGSLGGVLLWITGRLHESFFFFLFFWFVFVNSSCNFMLPCFHIDRKSN